MSDEPGQQPGQQPPGQVSGYAWADLLAALVETHGTLAAVAWKLIDHGPGMADDVASIERALRRLRGRGQLDGGIWGQRLLRVFGVPKSVEARLRWMGLYQSPFNDLPIALCLDQLRLWDRPPVSESRARVWLQLGQASCAARQQQFDEAWQHATSAAAAIPDRPATRASASERAETDDAARIEAQLVLAYLASRLDHDVAAHLDRAEQYTREASLEPTERACFEARLVDQRAYQLNKRGAHAEALAMYEALPDADVHPFASYRRDAGRAYGQFRAGHIARAVELAHRAIEHAGDGGYTRLRAMGLMLLAKFQPEQRDALARAHAIALRLDDRELLARVARASGQP